MNKNPFDEMQVSRRDRIGHQSFNLLVCLLLADSLIHGLGVQYLPYSVSTFALVILCCAVYVIRLAIDGSLTAPGRKPGRFAMIALSAALVGVVAVVWFKGVFHPQAAPGNESGGGAAVLLAVSGGGLVIAAAAGLIRFLREKHRENAEDR